MLNHDLNISNNKTYVKGWEIFYWCILKHGIMLGINSHLQISIYYFQIDQYSNYEPFKVCKIIIFQNSGTMPKLVPLQS